MAARWVTGSSWQALLVWSSVSAVSVPSPQRKGQTEVSRQQGIGSFQADFKFCRSLSQSERGSGLSFTCLYIRNNSPDKTPPCRMDVANKY